MTFFVSSQDAEFGFMREIKFHGTALVPDIEISEPVSQQVSAVSGRTGVIMTYAEGGDTGTMIAMCVVLTYSAILRMDFLLWHL